MTLRAKGYSHEVLLVWWYPCIRMSGSSNVRGRGRGRETYREVFGAYISLSLSLSLSRWHFFSLNNSAQILRHVANQREIE